MKLSPANDDRSSSGRHLFGQKEKRFIWDLANPKFDYVVCLLLRTPVEIKTRPAWEAKASLGAGRPDPVSAQFRSDWLARRLPMCPQKMVKAEEGNPW
jgi:hypothetical protein